MAQFVADFEAYMPATFNGEPYGLEGAMALEESQGGKAVLA